MKIVIKVGTSTLAHSTGRMNIRLMESFCKVRILSERLILC